MHKIDHWQDKLKMKVVSEFIPVRLYEESRIESIDRIQLINKCKGKAMLLIREICEKQLVLSNETLTDPDSKDKFFKVMVTILQESSTLIDMCSRITYCLYLMPVDKYSDIISKLIAWNKFHALN